MVVPFLLVLPKMSIHSLACDESSHISDDRLSGLGPMHLRHDLNIDVNEICTNLYKLFYQAQVEDVSRVHPLRVELKVWTPPPPSPQSKIPGSAHGK